MTTTSAPKRPVYFKNDGEIDPLSLVTMGASVKSKDSPIGYFGTGLKFAMASILRMGGEIEIFIGEKKYIVETRSTEIRGQDFDLIYIDGERAGYTTQLGRDWEPWMAYRELHSNALDEPNYEIDHGEPPAPKTGETQIRVWENKIQEEFYTRDKTFIETEPLFTVKNVEFHPGSGEKFIYYRGVKVGAFERPTMFRYNILNGLTLTEDRTIAHNWAADGEISRAIKGIEDVDVISSILTCNKKFMEHDIQHGRQTYDKSEAFMEAARNVLKDVSVDKSKIGDGAKDFLEAMRKQDVESATVIEPDSNMDAMLSAAIAKIAATGVPLQDHPIIVVETLGAGVMGLAKNGNAYLARAVFQNGQRYLEATLMEEWMHLTTGLSDYSRGMQDWLFAEILATHDRATGGEAVYAEKLNEESTDDEIPF